MSPQITDATLWLLFLALAAAALTAGVFALRHRKAASRSARQVHELEHSLRQRDDEIRHLTDHQLPRLVNALWSGHQPEFPNLLHPELARTPFAQAREALVGAVTGVAGQAAERAEGATQTAVKSVTRSMQALLAEQQGAIISMIERHHDEKVLADAIVIDHASNQLSRRAQTVAVLTGSWPGRQRTESPLLDVVRGGISRIRDFQRIKITGESPFAVSSRAVEPVVLALAELLDNAARHSEPGSDVQVWFVQAHNGVSIIIDDAGVGLKPEDKQTAARLLSGQEQVRLTRLRNPPKFGLAAVGVLAARYGFRASVEQESDFGGVRAVLYLPKNLLVTPAAQDGGEEEADTGARASARNAAQAAAAPAQAQAQAPAAPPAQSAPAPARRADPASRSAALDTPDPTVQLRSSRQSAPAQRPLVVEPALTESSRPRPEAVEAEPVPVAEPVPEPEPAEPFAERPDGLPQRRRRQGPPPGVPQQQPTMQPPSNSGRTLGAFARGRRAAQSPDTTDERNLGR